MNDWTVPPGAAPSRVHALRVRGSMAAKEDVVLEGQFEGDIEMPNHALTIGAAARVTATVFARDITVLGILVGKVTAIEIVDVRAGSSVRGDITAPSLVVEDGAVVQGRVEMKRADAAVRVARYRMERRDHGDRVR